MPSTPTWLESAPGVGVLAGPAAQIDARWSHRDERGPELQLATERPDARRPERQLAREGPNARRPDLQVGQDSESGRITQEADGLPRQAVSPDVVMDISAAAARRRATWRILKRTAKPTDGWVARHWNRPLSRPISYAALAVGLKASHASAITLLVGLATAAFAMRPGYLTLICTGVLFQLTSVLDGVDGEIARATLTESETGARLDAVVDQVTYVACFMGVALGWAREGGGAPALFWTAAIAIALVLSLVRGARFVSRHAPDASFVFIHRTIQRAAEESNLFTLRMAAESFSLLRRDLFAIVFLAVSFFGRRALVPGLVAFGIILANVTLSVYRRELAAAAVVERPGLR